MSMQVSNTVILDENIYFIGAESNVYVIKIIEYLGCKNNYTIFNMMKTSVWDRKIRVL